MEGLFYILIYAPTPLLTLEGESIQYFLTIMSALCGNFVSYTLCDQIVTSFRNSGLIRTQALQMLDATHRIFSSNSKAMYYLIRYCDLYFKEYAQHQIKAIKMIFALHAMDEEERQRFDLKSFEEKIDLDSDKVFVTPIEEAKMPSSLSALQGNSSNAAVQEALGDDMAPLALLGDVESLFE